jgi:hypothetical protein
MQCPENISNHRAHLDQFIQLTKSLAANKGLQSNPKIINGFCFMRGFVWNHA